MDLERDDQQRTLAASNHHEGSSSSKHLSISVEQFLQPEHRNLSNQETGSGSEPTEDVEHNDPILLSPMSVHCQKNSPEHYEETHEEQVPHSAGEFPGNGHLGCNSEQAANDIGQATEKTTELGELVCKQVPVVDTVEAENDRSKEPQASSVITCMKADIMVADSLILEKDHGKELEASKSGITCMNADVVVEKFPLRPVTRTIHSLEGKLDGQTNNNRILNPTNN